METKVTNSIAPRNVAKRLPIWMLVIAGVLIIPLVTNAPWTGSDFVFAGVVLFACAAVYEFAARNMSDIKHRAVIAAGVFFFIFMVIGWAASGP